MEWDLELLRSIFNEVDVEAISRIKLPQRQNDDFIAWKMEKSGMFTVRSAYNLALRHANLDRARASSVAPDGDRKLWSRIWCGAVPPKVNIFAWKLARDALPTRRAKFRRNLEVGERCALCDREAESSHHAVVVCPQAHGLRMAMRKHWLLLDEELFAYSGPDWLLLLLDRCSPIQRDLVKLVLWRAWTTHNNITHQSGPTGVTEGVQALLSMRSSLEQIEEGRQAGGDTVTTPSNVTGSVNRRGKRNVTGAAVKTWTPPPPGWYKINVDGSFVEANGEAGAGVIARDSSGQVLFTAWRVLFRCRDAVEAEAEGIRLAAEWAMGRVILESDCARVVQALKHGPDRSEIGFTVTEARELTQLLLEWKVSLAGRDCNKVAHELA